MAGRRKGGNTGVTAVIAMILAVCVAAAGVVGFLASSGSMGQVARTLGLSALTGPSDLQAGAGDQGKVLDGLPGPTANPSVDKGIGSMGGGPTANPGTDSGIGGLGAKPQANGGGESAGAGRNPTANGSTGTGGADDGSTSAGSQDNPSADPALRGLPAASLSPIDVVQARTELEDMTTETPHPQGYNRAKYFGGWANSPQLCGTGSTRDVILLRDLTGTKSNSNCKVQSGDFNDPYTGTSMKFRYGRDTSAEIQIDHVVALQDAWASGLWKADQATRVAYANDPEVLVASQGAANNEKSMGVNLYGPGKPSRLDWKAGTPSVWLPSNRPYQCAYMAKRVYIKHKYGLSMSAWERSETMSFLEGCGAD